MADQNQTPQLTPEERENRLKEVMATMFLKGEIRKTAVVGLTPQQRKEEEDSGKRLELLVEDIYEQNKERLGVLDDSAKKYVFPKVFEDVIVNIGKLPPDEMKTFILNSVKKHGSKWYENGQREKVKPWYADGHFDLHEYANHTIDELLEKTGKTKADYRLSIKDLDSLVSDVIIAIHGNDPKNKEEADEIAYEIISEKLKLYGDSAEQLDHVEANQSNITDTRGTVKDKQSVKRKYGKYLMIVAGGIVAVLAVAGGAHIGYKLKEWMNAPSKVAVSENKTNLETKVNDVHPNVPENITAQNPVNEAVEDYNEDVLPVPAEVKPEPAMPAVQADQPMNQETLLPEIYVPAPAVSKETHKEISKETFEAMYVLAKTKIQEKISNYAGLWNQFFQHTQTPAQIIPEIPAQISKQVQKDNFVYVHKPSRENTARNKSKAYVSANVGVIMPIRSDIYRQGAITAGLSAGVTNERDTELNIGAEIFKTSANGNENGTDWSAESKNFLVRVGARRNFPKQGTYVETDLEGLFSKSRFIVGDEYNVNEPDSSVTAGFGVGAGINTRNAEFGVRYIHFFNSGEVGHAVAVCAGCKF